MVTTESMQRHTTIIQCNSINGPAVSSSQTDSTFQGAGVMRSNNRHIFLEAIFASLRSASEQKAQDIVHQIRSNHSLEYIALSAATPAFSPSQTEDDETDQERIKSLAVEEPRADIISIAPANSISRRLPAKHKSEIKARSANAPRKKKSIIRKAHGHRVSEKEGTSMSRPQTYTPTDLLQVQQLIVSRP